MAELERHRLPFSSEKQSDEQAVTSPPQLNPMMNPVLGRNLGRWAEVYFTTPVEQREQAVTELLHELERGDQEHPDLAVEARKSAAAPVEPYTPDPTEQGDDQSIATTEHIAALEEAVRLFEQPGSRVEVDPLTSHSCPVCQHDNRPDQVYCGMCGYRISTAAAAETVVELSPLAERSAESHAQNTEMYFPSFGSQLPYARQPEYVETVDRAPLWPLHVEDESPRWGSAFKVIAVAIILAGAAWLFLQQRRPVTPTPVASTSSQQTAPASQPSTTEPVDTSPANAPAAQSASSRDRSEAEGSDAVPPVSAPAEAQKSMAPPTNEITAPVATTQSPAKAALPVDAGRPPASRTSSDTPSTNTHAAALAKPLPTADGGTEELDRARELLAGRSSPPDAGQASLWLWKAVSKHNLPAVLLLADLYARGEGVSRNCDQARVLLTAALKRGSVEAGQRLQELQRSGCSER
jgi:hypothetical protein